VKYHLNFTRNLIALAAPISEFIFVSVLKSLSLSLGTIFMVGEIFSRTIKVAAFP